MNHIVSFSGGVCSFWAAKRVIDEFGTSDVTLLFADTLIEDDDLYRFLVDCSIYFGIPVTTIADGRTPWEVFRDEKMIGNSRVDMCSRILKRELLWSWIESSHNPSNTVVCLGMDHEELGRLEGVQAQHPGWTVKAPMQERPWMTKCDMIKNLGKLGIAEPRLYGEGFPHNNCGGFCIKSGISQFVLLLKTRPESFMFHENKEQEMRQYLEGDYSILKDRRGGVTKPMTLKTLRLRVESGDTTLPKHEWGGCGCAY